MTADRAARTRELLEAALAVIRREGPNATMDRIALEAGITKPVLYRHFGDKAGLYGAVADTFMSELREGLAKALRIDAPGHEIVYRTIDTYLQSIEEDPQVYEFLIQEARLGPPDPDAPVENFIRQVAGLVTVAIAAEMTRLGADMGAAEPWGFGITGMVQLAGDWWIERRSMPRARLAEYLANLCWAGISGIIPGADEGN